VTITTDLSGGRADPSAADHPSNSADTVVAAGGGSADDFAVRTPTQRLRLTVQHPAVGVRVVAVDGELDLHTAPLLDACVREQLAAVPTNLTGTESGTGERNHRLGLVCVAEPGRGKGTTGW
jgi:alcohol dehydrogenase class IV